jgi:hypothetical protein
LRVPPKWLAICFVQEKGASIAQAHATGTCGSLVGPPISSILSSVLARPSWMPSKLASSLKVPSKPPSALAPLSPTTYMTMRIVQFAGCFQAVDQATHLVIGVSHEFGVIFNES